MDFESALNSIPATEAAFNQYDWLHPVNDFGTVIDTFRQDNFYEGSTSISDSITILQQVHADIDRTQIFYHNYPEKQQLMETILQDMVTYGQKKTSMDPTIVMQAVGKYNDNLEKARAEYYRKFLRDQCEQYNQSSNRRVMAIDYYFQGTHPDYYDAGEYYDEFWRETDTGFQQIRTSTRYPVTTEYYKIYDEIHYDALVKAWDTFFDMSNDKMVKALEKRGYQVERFERPADSYYR